jgi:DNA helicase-2/ATP-dependent DNA helicase PcrA
MQLVNNPHDEVALLRVINRPTRGIGKTTIERLAAHALQHRMSLLDAAREVRNVENIAARSGKLVSAFVAMVDRLISAVGPIEELLGLVLSESGYEAMLKASGDEEDEERLANIQELLTVAREFDERHPGAGHLEAFLEETALVNDTDEWETQLDRVTLMTLHASKGLEFPCVYLVAVEEGLLPHERSRGVAEQLEEERRLMFVGITRAQQRLQISRAEYRDFRGERKMAVPSSFLMELPRGEMEVNHPEGTRVVEMDDMPEDHEPVFRHDEPEEPAPHSVAEVLPPAAIETPTPRVRTPAATLPRLQTAADMLQQSEARPVIDPDAFRQGMVVLHAEFGLGKVVALGGSGEERTATVDFATGAGRKKVPLTGGALKPMK